jgi:hypothetical protein
MTEAEWLACADPTPMLRFLESKVSERKLRLFACACCRRIWHLLSDQKSKIAVEVAERYADRQATLDELKTVSEAAIAASWAVQDELDGAWPTEPTCCVLPAAEAAEMSAYPMPDGKAWGLDCGYGSWNATAEAVAFRDIAEVLKLEQAHQATLLRCIFGNPFRPIAFIPSWFNSKVVSFAQQMYDSRDFSAMPILADALQDAGCDNEDVLNHCRGNNVHVRGCFVVDLLLGKE